MVQVIDFQGQSLPKNVADMLKDKGFEMPPGAIRGLRAVARSAFQNSKEDEQLERVIEAIKIMDTAQQAAGEFYPHLNGNLPEHVATILAGHMELLCEAPENDLGLSERCQALLEEVRGVYLVDEASLSDPKFSVDAHL